MTHRNEIGRFRERLESGPRTRTLTIWATEEEVRRIDAYAHARGLSRANFLHQCVNAGFKALRVEGVSESTSEAARAA
jgi:hypothetical protein